MTFTGFSHHARSTAADFRSQCGERVVRSSVLRVNGEL